MRRRPSLASLGSPIKAMIVERTVINRKFENPVYAMSKLVGMITSSKMGWWVKSVFSGESVVPRIGIESCGPERQPNEIQIGTDLTHYRISILRLRKNTFDLPFAALNPPFPLRRSNPTLRFPRDRLSLPTRSCGRRPVFCPEACPAWHRRRRRLPPLGGSGDGCRGPWWFRAVAGGSFRPGP